MSVYRPKRKDGSFSSPFFHYDFEFNRRRFFGSTGAKTRKAAEHVERLKRIEADKAADGTSITGAFARFWTEVGQHDRSSDVTFYRLERLQDGLTAVLAEAGKTALLAAVTENELARYVARRRAVIGRHSKSLSPSSINRELQILRRVMRRAVMVWRQALTLPAWRALLLAEPEEHVVDIAAGLEEKILDGVRPDYRPSVRFVFMTGLRLGSVFASPGGHGPLRPEAVDFEARIVTVKTKSKKPGGKSLRLPITRAMRLLLANEIGRHPDAVFTYRATSTRNGRLRGHCYPITKSGFYKVFKAACEDLGVGTLRPHDGRHTAGSRLLSETGNLRLVQLMLGHSRVSTTQRYTHPTVDSLRAAKELVHGPELGPELASPAAANTLTDKKKSA